MAKKLIITADDFGISRDINSGIIYCYTRGAITDISLLSVGDAFEDAVNLARKGKITRLGVHLALTGGFKPLSLNRDVKTLTGKEGSFPDSYLLFLMRYLLRRVNSDEIYIEFKNQIARAKKTGFKVTHIDSHHHIHIVPGILEIVLRIMREENIAHVRFPYENAKLITKLRNPAAWMRNLLLSTMCRISKRILQSSTARHNDYFIGHMDAMKLNKKRLIALLGTVRDGLTELGCHPGYATPASLAKYPKDKSREAEIEALCDGEFHNEVKTQKIELGSH